MPKLRTRPVTTPVWTDVEWMSVRLGLWGRRPRANRHRTATNPVGWGLLGVLLGSALLWVWIVAMFSL